MLPPSPFSGRFSTPMVEPAYGPVVGSGVVEVTHGAKSYSDGVRRMKLSSFL